jgi:adenylosuccinate lyase
LLERTLDDSANRRIVLPEAFLAVDEVLLRACRLVQELRIDTEAIARTLHDYGIFAATERLLMELVKAGASRQEMHEVLRSHSMAAWADVRAGRRNSLPDLLCADARVSAYLAPEGVRALLDATDYVGDAPRRARALAGAVRRLGG